MKSYFKFIYKEMNFFIFGLIIVKVISQMVRVINFIDFGFLKYNFCCVEIFLIVGVFFLFGFFLMVNVVFGIVVIFFLVIELFFLLELFFFLLELFFFLVQMFFFELDLFFFLLEQFFLLLDLFLLLLEFFLMLEFFFLMVVFFFFMMEFVIVLMQIDLKKIFFDDYLYKLQFKLMQIYLYCDDDFVILFIFLSEDLFQMYIVKLGNQIDRIVCVCLLVKECLE